MGNACLEPGLVAGRTVLVLKDKLKGSIPSNYRPITCLSVVWKFLTGILRALLYAYLTDNGLIPIQQKGCTQNSKGTKDHLLVDMMLMNDAKIRHRNLFMAWVDL